MSSNASARPPLREAALTQILNRCGWLTGVLEAAKPWKVLIPKQYSSHNIIILPERKYNLLKLQLRSITRQLLTDRFLLQDTGEGIVKNHMKLFKLLSIAFAASLLANGFLAWKLSNDDRKIEVQLASPDRVEVIRTKGGLLQVSTVKSTETFQATKDHRLLSVVPLGQTTTQIRVPAVFHYHIELAPEWKVNIRDKTLIVVAPPVRPTLPIAIDTARLQRFSSGTWSLLTGRTELDALQRSITQTLAVKASTPSYIQFQREVARKTVEEFVEKWLITQAKWEAKRVTTIRVFFADESIGSLESLPLAFKN